MLHPLWLIYSLTTGRAADLIVVTIVPQNIDVAVEKLPSGSIAVSIKEFPSLEVGLIKPSFSVQSLLHVLPPISSGISSNKSYIATSVSSTISFQVRVIPSSSLLRPSVSPSSNFHSHLSHDSGTVSPQVNDFDSIRSSFRKI